MGGRERVAGTRMKDGPSLPRNSSAEIRKIKRVCARYVDRWNPKSNLIVGRACVTCMLFWSLIIYYRYLSISILLYRDGLKKNPFLVSSISAPKVVFVATSLNGLKGGTI